MWSVADGRTRPRPQKKKKGQTEKEKKLQRQKSSECNNISEASVLFVDVESGNLSAIFLAAAISCCSALTPTRSVRVYLLVSDTLRQLV